MKKLYIIPLSIMIFAFNIYPFGPKKFVKSIDGGFWCRDRVTHSGRQCCLAVSQEELRAPKILASKSKLNSIDRGYGSNCDHNCKCTVTTTKCRTQENCKNAGTEFVCKKGECILPCKKDIECVNKFGNGYGCVGSICAKKRSIVK